MIGCVMAQLTGAGRSAGTTGNDRPPGQAAAPPGSVRGADFAETLRRAQAGEPAAFGLLWEQNQPRLLGYLRLLAGQSAEDVASDSWLQAIKGLRRFSGDEAAFRSWLFTIARRKAIDLSRRSARRPEQPTAEPPESEPAADAATLALEHISTEAALRLIATLPAEQAEIVMLRVVAGLDVAEVARLVGRTPGAVRVSAHRALRRLAEQLEGNSARAVTG